MPTPASCGASAHSQSSIRLDIQGLRAVAVLSVLIYHADASWLKAGFIGVDIFFVISGFIITALLTERGAKVELGAFYASRIKRILPAYLVMLVVVSVVAAILFLPADFATFGKSLQASALFTSNLYFAKFGSYFAPLADELPLLHTWSLAIEMQFYLFFPILIIAVPAHLRRPLMFVLAMVLFAWSGYQMLGGERRRMLYFSLMARIPEFLVGACVALTFRQRELPANLATMAGLLGAALVGCSLWLIDKTQFPGLWSILPCLGAALLVAARRGPVNRLLASAPMVWLGAVSYSLYLWHWPILAFIRYYTGQYTLTASWWVAFVLGSLLLAWLSYHLVEQPVRKAGRVRQHWGKWSAALAALVLVAVSVRYLNEHLTTPLPLEMTTYAPGDQICHGKIVGDCKRGAYGVPISALVIGDSHAAQLNFFFDEVGRELGTAYRVISGSNCVPIPGFDVERLVDWAQAPCRAQMQVVEGQLPSLSSVVIAGMWQLQVQSPAFVAAFERFLRTSSEQGKTLVVLAQVPMFADSPLRMSRFDSLGLPSHIEPDADWRAANATIRRLVEGVPGARFVDLSDSELFEHAPFYKGSLIYMDSHHLNQRGAHAYGQAAVSSFRQLLIQTGANRGSQP